MKLALVILSFLLVNLNVAVAQDFFSERIWEMNELILQISANTPGKFQSFQTLNQDLGNFVLTQQIGTSNKSNIDQDHGTCSGLTNYSVNVQIGNLNDLTIEQTGSGNLFVGFQFGNPVNWLSRALAEFDLGFGNASLEENMGDYNGIFTGEGNKVIASQEGMNNTLIAVQQGNDNFISAVQKGVCNYLIILQKGAYNSVTGYEQGNASESILADKITQEGENLTISSTGISGPKVGGNTFAQSGTNLSLRVNQDFINDTGGMEIRQTGRDMNVVVQQSYFLFQ
ncbi:MAG: hypothetical protein AB2L24_27880 [Mangrovibacterium sp.]